MVPSTLAAALAGCGSGSGVIGRLVAIAAHRRFGAQVAAERCRSYPGRAVRSLTSVSSQTGHLASTISETWSSDQRPARFQVPMRTGAISR